jgi:CrcB protein
LPGWLFVALGSALGGVARYAVASVFPLLPGRWPLATMLVNLAGSLLIGILSVALGVRGGGPDTVRLFWLTGVLGGFTTYSAFALETTLMVGTGANLRAFGYVLVTVVGCLAAALAGRAIGALLAGET